MDRFITFLSLFVIFTAATASSIKFANSSESNAVSSHQPRALTTISKNGKAYPPNSLVVKSACIVDILDALSVQYHTQAPWHDLQTK